MKRFLLSITLVLGIGTVSALAGGGHYGGGHGGGCWGGGYHGGGCWSGHGYYCGGHGYCGGYWPTFSFGIGFGYPAYGYYGYPAYGYAYAPVYSTYAYSPAQPTVSVAVAAAPTVRPATASVVYYRQTPTYGSPKPSNPAPTMLPPAPVAAPRPSTGTWVMDPTPYRYAPAPATMYVNAGAPTTIVSVR